MKTIGLTGGIGSGKSTVARLLAELGAEVIHADLVGHEVYHPGTPGFDRVVEAFGRDVVGGDGTIDRRKLAALVFADAGALAHLNRIVHPLIAAEIQRRIDSRRAEDSGCTVVVEAAVLLEAGWSSLVDEVWVVRAPEDSVVDRVGAERGLDPEQIRARMRTQLTDEDRRRQAAVVIDNAGTLDDLRTQVGRAWEERGSRT